MTNPAHLHTLEQHINQSWDQRDQPEALQAAKEHVKQTLELLDQGKIRVAAKVDGNWLTHQWIKKAILLSFRLNPNRLMPGAPGNGLHGGNWYDKVDSKFATWDEAAFQAAQIRAVPGAIVRKSAFIAPNVILMPSFVNVGAYVDAGTMVDTWVTIGSCAQIGKNCHISGGVGIGGVLEPLQADPVIIEDNCFIGARSEIAEGVIVEEGAVISMGVFLGASTKIVDRATGEITRGRVPAYSVVVPGTLAANPGEPALSCAVIVKRVDAQTRAKTSLNDLLRF
jgi:2,3,4,5-tetrahydropyridine-2-carboxylate N-succinyltransferase